MFIKNKNIILFVSICLLLIPLNTLATITQNTETGYHELDSPITVDTNQMKDPEIELLIAKTYQTLQGVKGGKNADYIPELAKVPSELLGIALATVDGTLYTAGDVEYTFSIQSISKPFTAALMMMVYQSTQVIVDKIGVEPTGQPFNSVIALEMIPTRTGNPLVNAGAITTVSYLHGSDPEEKFNRIRSFLGGVIGNRKLKAYTGEQVRVTKTESVEPRNP